MKVPFKSKNFFPFIFAFVSLLFFIKPNNYFARAETETDPFDISKKKELTKAINSEDKEKYLSIQLDGNDESINYIISVYSDNAKSDRIQLGQSYNGKTKIFLNLNAFKDVIYLDLECSKYNCAGKIIYEIQSTIQLEEGESFSYYVYNGNKKMVFSLNTDSIKSNVWARGQFNIKTSLNIENTQRINDKGNFYIVNKKMNDVEFIVEGEEGDYINVGYIGYNENNNDEYDSNKNILIDGTILTGFLKKKELEKICFRFSENSILKTDYIFGTGNIFNKFINSYSAKTDGTKLSKEELFSSGYIKNVFESKEIDLDNLKQCFSFPNIKSNDELQDLEEIIFTYQLSTGSYSNVYEPQINGIFYPRFTSRDSLIAFIGQKKEQFEKMTLSLMAINGYPKMYVYNCKDYPLCNFMDEDDPDNNIRPRNINRFSSLSFEKEKNSDNSPISKSQTIFFVECQRSQQVSENNHFDKYCEFNTLIFKDNDIIELLEDQYYNQFAVENEVHNFRIKISKEREIQKIFVDIMTFVGEVDVTHNEYKDMKINSYFAINKIYLSAKIDEYSQIPDEFNFRIRALSNTYYTILVNIGREDIDDSLITNELQTGMSYLVTIDQTKKDQFYISNKVVKFINEKSFDYENILINFYSLNCKISGGRTYNNSEGRPVMDANLKNYEDFLYDIITPNSENYNSPEYVYRLNVDENDPSDYEGKLCKIYASAIELSDKHEKYTRDILIPDNTPQQIMFGKEVKHVSYGYIHVDHVGNDVLIKFNLKHTAQYKVQIYYEYELTKQAIIVSNEVLFLRNRDWKLICSDHKRVCYIQIDITMEASKYDEEPVLEFSIKSIATKSVSYVQKNILKRDYIVNNNTQYYYTELGKNENGFVIANFLRGSGKVLGKVVSKDIEFVEQDANWRGKYRLPTENELILMDPFTKKLDFYTYGLDCEKGCFLIISVLPDVIPGDINTERNYPYSLLVHTYPSDKKYDQIPFIRIPLDEYVIGTVEESPIENRMFEFYSVLFNTDAEYIVIDFQSDAGGLFINVGNKPPTTTDAQLKFWPKGKDALYKINKSDIGLKNLKGKTITIGIWANMTDSVFTSPFAFVVRLENENEDYIYRFNSDQKSLCNPRKIKNREKYRCVYVMEYDYISLFNDFFIYANAQDKSALLDIYVQKINSTAYELGSFDFIEKNIPDENNKYLSTKDTKKDYLDLNEIINEGEYILVSVETNKETIIELMSTFTLYLGGVTPNPATPQLFMVVSHTTFTLNFPNDYMVMANLICIDGGAKIFWTSDPDNKYYIKGRDDRLSITSQRPELEHQMVIEATEEMENNNGFIFIVEYNIRVQGANFDALNLDKSIKYIYTDNDLPIMYYTPLETFNMKTNSYYDLFFSFINFENEIDKKLTFYENIPFNVKGNIVTESQIYRARLIPEIGINSDIIIDGKYDPATRTGTIRILKNDIENAHFPDYIRPYLYLRIDKTEEFKSIRKFKNVQIETTVLQSNSLVPISEYSNQFGYLSKDEIERKYVIRTNNTMKYMNLQFSCLNEKLQIEIENRKLNKELTIYGKSYYSLEMNEKEDDTVNLIIKRKDRNNKNEEYFMFQYTFSDKKYESKYSIKNTALSVEKKHYQKEYNVTIKLKPVDNSDKLNLAYIIRAIYEGDAPENPDLTMKFNKQAVKEYYNPEKDENGDLNFEIYAIKSKIKYIQIIVQIQNNEGIEYLSYDFHKFTEKDYEKYDIDDNDENEEDSDDDNENRGAIIAAIIIGSFLFVTAVILVIIWMKFNYQNKDLLEQVNKISFAEEKKNDTFDLLLNS